MVPPIGLVKKILKLRPKVHVCITFCHFVSCSLKLQGIDEALPVVTACTPTTNPSIEGNASSVGSSPSTSTNSVSCDSLEIPSHWRPEVEECIKERYLSDTARLEIVRVLVTQLFARSTKPSRPDCERYGRKLILKYPFMRDDRGNGYVSILFSNA